MPLEEKKDLMASWRALKPAAFHWRSIGTQLAVQASQLEKITSKNRDEALLEVLSYAIQNRELEWEDIAESLEKVGRIKEAKETRNKHCPSLRLECDNVGKFLIVVYLHTYRYFIEGIMQVLPLQKSAEHNLVIRLVQ